MSDTAMNPIEQTEHPGADPGMPASTSDQAFAEMAAHSDLAGQASPATAGDPAVDSGETAASPAQETDAFQPGRAFTGRVSRVTTDQVFVNLDGEQRGAVPLIEFAGQPLPRENDEITVVVDRYDSDAGIVVLSKRQADELAFWQAVKPGDVLEGVVTGMNKGGLDVDIGGARAFLPSSQVDLHKMRDISVLIGEHVRCVVTQVDRATHDLVLSRRKYQEKEREDHRRQLIEALVEGELHAGKVTSLTDYGAFVDLGGVDGLIHITDLSWGRFRHPSDVVQEGQQLEVRILKVDREKGKVSLGLKQARPDPWTTVVEKYPVGSRVRGRVLRLADFGAFIELEEGVEALLPISEMSWSKKLASPGDVVKVGDEPETVVLKVDADKRRISLGLKQTEENPWTTLEAKFPVNTKTRGKVTKLMEFGAFVEIAPGVEGLIHISELSERRVRAVADVVKEGQEVEVRVIKLDMEHQRVSLSMKPEPAPVPAAAAAAKGKVKPRKKPLRGGLASHFEW